MRRSTSGLEAWERKLPNQALWSHGTGDSGKGLIADLGAKLAVSDMTSNGEAMETMRMKLERRETDWKQRSYSENIGETAPSWILPVN